KPTADSYHVKGHQSHQTPFPVLGACGQLILRDRNEQRPCAGNQQSLTGPQLQDCIAAMTAPWQKSDVILCDTV
ncbi:mCG122656, isoform CRA_a, partial [Mus musculus]